jgi:outer membrane protein assembly factor BamA
MSWGLLQEEVQAPRSDQIGGDLLFSLLAQLRFPLPVPAMQAAGMYGHVFVNGGNLVQLSGTENPLEQSIRDFPKHLRWSAVCICASLHVLSLAVMHSAAPPF